MMALAGDCTTLRLCPPFFSVSLVSVAGRVDKKKHHVVVGLLRVIFSVLSKRYDLERHGFRSP